MTMILTQAQSCCLLGSNRFAMHSFLRAIVRTTVKKFYIDCEQARVLVLSYLASNKGLNLYYNCQNSVMVEQDINDSMEQQV